MQRKKQLHGMYLGIKQKEVGELGKKQNFINKIFQIFQFQHMAFFI